MKLNGLEGKTVREIEARLQHHRRVTPALLLLVAGAALLIAAGVIWHHQAACDALEVENKTLKEEINILKEKLAGRQVTGALPGNELYLYHEIKPGDTLGKISQQYFGTGDYAARLAELNGLTTKTTLQVGQVLKIPKQLE